MKYIKLFEAFTKDYMKKIDLNDFKKIKKGTKIKYMGGSAVVLDNDGYVLKLKGEDGKTVTVNKSQFDHGGMISEISVTNEGKIELALNKIEKWMPEDQDVQQEYYDIIDKGNVKDMEEFLDIHADEEVLKSFGIKYRDLGKLAKAAIDESVVTESSAKDGGDKSNNNSHHEDHKSNSIAQHWKDTYGEDFHSKYPAIAKIVKSRPGLDKRELKRIWDETYGENFEEQYPALWQKLD